MTIHRIKKQIIADFQNHLQTEEKSTATIEKYIRDARAFFVFCDGRPVDKNLVAAYKQLLIDSNYAVRSINSMLASVNSLLDFLGWQDCKVKNIKGKRLIFDRFDF